MNHHCRLKKTIQTFVFENKLVHIRQDQPVKPASSADPTYPMGLVFFPLKPQLPVWPRILSKPA